MVAPPRPPPSPLQDITPLCCIEMRKRKRIIKELYRSYTGITKESQRNYIELLSCGGGEHTMGEGGPRKQSAQPCKYGGPLLLKGIVELKLQLINIGGLLWGWGQQPGYLCHHGVHERLSSH